MIGRLQSLQDDRYYLLITYITYDTAHTSHSHQFDLIIKWSVRSVGLRDSQSKNVSDRRAAFVGKLSLIAFPHPGWQRRVSGPFPPFFTLHVRRGLRQARTRMPTRRLSGPHTQPAPEPFGVLQCASRFPATGASSDSVLATTR